VTKLAIAHFPEFASRGVCTRKFVVALSATAKINSDSIGNKVTRLILLEFLDFSALRIGNTTSNMEAKPSTCAPATAQLRRADAQCARGGGRRCARPPRRLMTMSKSRSSVAGSSAALNALFRAKQSIDSGENLQIHPALYGVPEN